MGTGAKRLELKKALALEQMAIFAGVSQQATAWLSQFIQEKSFPTGQTIAESGVLSEELYIIGAGSADVLMPASGNQKEPTLIAKLQERDCFGEMSFIEKIPRCAMVRAAEFTRVYILPWDAIDRFRIEWPDQHAMLILNLARALSRRLRTLDRLFSARAF